MMQRLRNCIKSALLDRLLVPYSLVPGVQSCVFQQFRESSSVNIVDVGAYKGDFTKGMQALCGVKSAVLFEPNEILANSMRADVALAGFSIEDCALSDFDGEIKMRIFPQASYMSSALILDLASADLALRAGDEEVIIRPARRLDSIPSVIAMTEVDLLKIDVQGLEHLVIKGATETLKRAKVVLIEVSFRPLYKGSAVFHEIHACLSDSGFMMTALERGYCSDEGELLQADALFIRTRQSS
jgi:FkbM family methyltransferase